MSRRLCLCLLGFALQLWALSGRAEEMMISAQMPMGNPERGRLVFAPCRTCHYPEAFMGHNNGPNLHRIFGKVAGKQEGFEYYSETFKAARFVWTPVLLYNWLENPMAMFPDTSMMSLGVPDPQQRADLIAFLMRASVLEVSDPNASQ